MFLQGKYPLFLAPMEGVGDAPFRKAMAFVGGFDAACTPFLRVPSNAYIPGLVQQYDPLEMDPFPLAAQVMGADPHLMAEMARALEAKGALRIDINCGCPSHTVNGRGAGASLLKSPQSLYEIASSMAKTVSIPVSLKMRSGFTDTSLFRDNLQAVEESGVAFVTIHPRTKAQGYTGKASWELIAEAKQLLSIPVVGNGDVCTKEDVERMKRETKCDGVMIGRGAVINPWIFHEIRGEGFSLTPQMIEGFYERYRGSFPETMPQRTRINKLKQMASFQYLRTESLQKKKTALLRSSFVSEEELWSRMLEDFTC